MISKNDLTIYTLIQLCTRWFPSWGHAFLCFVQKTWDQEVMLQIHSLCFTSTQPNIIYPPLFGDALCCFHTLHPSVFKWWLFLSHFSYHCDIQFMFVQCFLPRYLCCVWPHKHTNRWMNKTSQTSLWIIITFNLCLWIPAQLWCLCVCVCVRQLSLTKSCVSSFHECKWWSSE